MTSTLRVAYIVLALAAAMPLLSACNTMEGLGRDVSAAGDALTGASRDTKGY